MSLHKDTTFQDLDLPLVAILRGVMPKEVLKIATVLVGQGFTKIEVPLNSPDALSSITLLSKEFDDTIQIGAGTVTQLSLAQAVIDTGAKLIVTPNFDHAVVKAALAAKCECYCGVVTPTECFAAIQAGVTKLKVFPISMLNISGFKALKSVLPSTIKTYPVGGIEATAHSMHPYLAAGATGFGLGSALYRPNMSLDELASNAKAFVKTFRAFDAAS